MSAVATPPTRCKREIPRTCSECLGVKDVSTKAQLEQC